MSASEPGGHSASGSSGDRHELVRLVTRLVTAQAVVAAAVGLPFSRRQLSSILITLGFVVTFAVLALMVRSGARATWLIGLCYEAGFFVFGLSRFVFARYVGGTLLALIIVGTLLHPAVARAYGTGWGRMAAPVGDDADAAGETFGGRTVG